MFRDRISPRAVLNLIDRLPRSSHLRHEMAQDEDLARDWLASDAADDDKPVAVPVTEWTPEVERLTRLIDLMAQNLAVLVAVNSEGGFRQPELEQRPETAVDRLMREAQDQAYTDLVNLVEEARKPAREEG